MGFVEDFFSTLQVYNESAFLITILTYFLGLAAMYLVSRGSRQASRFVSGILGFLWLWSGIVFNMLFFGPSDVEILGVTVTGLWYFAGILFIVQGLLFTVLGAAEAALSFSPAISPYSAVGAVFIVYATVIYPAVGFLTGYPYPRYPIFGSAPCPVTIFTWGLLLWVSRKVPLRVAAIPFAWGIMGVVPVLVLNVYADIGLVLSGIMGLSLILLHNRSVERENGSWSRCVN